MTTQNRYELDVLDDQGTRYSDPTEYETEFDAKVAAEGFLKTGKWAEANIWHKILFNGKWQHVGEGLWYHLPQPFGENKLKLPKYGKKTQEAISKLKSWIPPKLIRVE